MPRLLLTQLKWPTLKPRAAFDFGDDGSGNSTGANGSKDGSSEDGSSTKGGTIASGVNRLKNAGTAISAYEPEPIAASGAVELACGFGYVDPNFQGAYIGVGSSAFSKGFSCGRCVKIQCDDAFCTEPGKSVVAQVVDLCGDCYDNDIAMAIPAWQNLTGKDPSNNPNVEISWDYVDCAPFINGTIKMLIKPGGNAYFQAFNFANSIMPITAVQLNGDRLRHSTNHFWEWNPGKAINPPGPFQLALLGSNKQVLRVTFKELRSQDLKGTARQGYWNDVQPDQIENFACGIGGVSPHFQTRFAGFHLSHAGERPCGMCLEASCANATLCPAGRRQVVLQVLDFCADCGQDDLNLPPPVYQEISGAPGTQLPSFPVEWRQVECGGLIEGDIYLRIAPGELLTLGPYWQAWTLGNSGEPVEAVSINGEQLEFVPENNQWLWYKDGQPLNTTAPLELGIKGASGRTLTATLPSLESQTLTGVQFPFSGAAQPAREGAGAGAASAAVPVAEP
ncbi:Expansin 1 [Chlorella sorokiniana]|uniref:Expansin 1 n=1 Tax=Chlorella sorokiniana TaxID=3076 RepID=A0A2P6TUD2_CHLSO|nr:Expansin 1 [Chlorella sorokiniana]|eukprot:PRW57682.1 Expansin 1 [Chlorella sorokiniana]